MTTALKLLQRYETYHQEGNDALKQCFWNLTKSRHHKGGDPPVRLADDDMEATLRLIAKDEEQPNLVNEDLRLVDSRVKENSSVALVVTTSNTSTLRHRSKKQEENKWTQETVEAPPKQTPNVTLMGGAARDVEEARVKAQAALEHYVQTANRARAVLRFIQETQKD